MVCLGNICRSPIAEGVLRHKLKENGLNWTVESAGTESYHVGEPPHKFSQKICLAHGIDIGHQRARKFVAGDFDQYDKIYAMAGDVYSEIRRIGGIAAEMQKVDYFLNELFRSRYAGIAVKENDSVPDPYFDTEAAYTVVFEMIDKTCDAIVARYTKENYE